ncbi:MAG: SGNH/GDSL hydrolase family protein [Prevotella sp.]|nr:SGNH/GDSL hydrolase family protein [Prevotella sp.]MCM1074682.1 SGNH/GDSL hydrolase family protein [Ruminococcus sp.]
MKSKYTSLWLLLAIALAGITMIAFMDDIEIAGYKIKKAPIAEALTGEYKTTEEVMAQDEQIKIEAEKKQEAQHNEVDTMPQNILVFGDSMTQNIARRLAAYASQNGHTIHTVNWDSSGTKIWSKTDTLTYYIKEFKPTYIFVSLGGNESGYGKPEVLKPNVEKILEKIGDIPFVWIGPPSLKNGESDKYSDMLGSTLPPGTFFRSDKLKLERRGDKIHPTVKAAAYQVDELAKWIENSAHPIKMDFPADSVADTKIKDTNIVYLKPMH